MAKDRMDRDELADKLVEVEWAVRDCLKRYRQSLCAITPRDPPMIFTRVYSFPFAR